MGRGKRKRRSSKRASKEGGEEKEKKKKRKRRRREVNIEAWIDKYIEDFVSLTGLDILGLSKDKYKELLSDIIVQLYGSLTSYSNVKTLAKRYARARDRINELLAARLAYMLKEPTHGQLEFIVYNLGPNTTLSVAPKLYPILKKKGLDDLIDILRVKWRSAWLAKRREGLLPPCPKCGFNSLTPLMTCLVCGSSVSDSEVRSTADFKEKFKEYVSEASCEDLRKLLRHSSVLYSDLGIKPPWEGRGRVDVEVYLSRAEVELIKSEIERRCRGQGGNGSS